jgi:hypothetical protein
LLRCRMPVRFSGTVLSLQGPPVGQLPCPGRTCASPRPPLRALPRARSSGSKCASPHDRPVHPLPHNVRHPLVAPSLHILYGVRSALAEQPRSSAAGCPAASFVGLSPSSTGRHMAEVAVPSSPSAPSSLLSPGLETAKDIQGSFDYGSNAIE